MKITKYILLMLLSLTACKSSVRVDSSFFEEKIGALGSIAIKEYELSKIVCWNMDSSIPFTDPSTIIGEMKARVKVGIDLSQVEVLDFDEESMKLVLYLPPTEYILMDVGQYNEVFKREGFREVEAQDREKVQREGQNNIETKLLELGLLKDAEKDAQRFLRIWLRNFGVRSVKFKQETKETKVNK